MAEEIKEEEKEIKEEDKKEIKEDKKEKTKIDIKELFNKNKKLAIGIIAGVVVLIVIIVLVVSLTGNKDEKDPGKNNGGNGNGEEEQYPDDAIFSDEETIKNEYGFSKEDAIKVIKAFYHSDNYTFEAKARKDNMYEVTVTNTDTKEITVYEVDPNDGSFVYLPN